jgi:DNA-binding NarL/FixJ family response regulator
MLASRSSVAVVPVSSVARAAAVAPPPRAEAPCAPVRLLLDVPVVVRAGLGALLEPLHHLVEVLDDHAAAEAEVVVFDPDGCEGDRPGSTALGVPRVALTWDPSLRTAARARELGAVAVLPLSVRALDLVRTLEAVRDRPAEAPRREPVVLGLLSPREADVVSGICRGLSNAEIAEELFLSVNSVKTYIRTAYRKMGVGSRSQAVLWGFRHGL